MLKKLPLLKKPVIGRLCWECEHYDYSPGDEGYSDDTPGYQMSMNCGKDYWIFDPCADSPSLRACLTTAERCADFRLRHAGKDEEP